VDKCVGEIWNIDRLFQLGSVMIMKIIFLNADMIDLDSETDTETEAEPEPEVDHHVLTRGAECQGLSKPCV